MRHVVLASLLLAACAHPQLAYRFQAPQAGAEPVLPHVARVLASQGQQVTSVDEVAGIVYTRWQDTGFMYGQIDNVPADLVRRYVVTLAPSGEIQVRQDTQRCAQGSFTIGDAGVQGSCVQAEGLVEKHQKELDTLGSQLQAALK